MKELEKRVVSFGDGTKKEYYINNKGEYHGSCKWYWDNKWLGIDCNYVNGNRHGIYKDFWCNGKMSFIQQYKKGDNHGVRIEFNYWYMKKLEKVVECFPIGTTAREYYVNYLGQHQGLYKRIHDNGETWYLTQYKKDEIHGIDITFVYYWLIWKN